MLKDLSIISKKVENLVSNSETEFNNLISEGVSVEELLISTKEDIKSNIVKELNLEENEEDTLNDYEIEYFLLINLSPELKLSILEYLQLVKIFYLEQ